MNLKDISVWGSYDGEVVAECTTCLTDMPDWENLKELVELATAHQCDPEVLRRRAEAEERYRLDRLATKERARTLPKTVTFQVRDAPRPPDGQDHHHVRSPDGSCFVAGCTSRLT